ncbi:uncharacterized protein A1O9_09640 [Exophiala aquamarina CBS 119918]|uniref:Zn(2)-C6 fungal-type domain-containing protein n=1 Tax=Exophiala aquamarina CBS 119918 TaxID=1182545 RepID=A0A072P5A7_9EURO|nr:uncharacterized protein A1O9_09640 [Exophiala aquamarina CBS 119918]KEF54473.1 hypothetical protein A1O9_09640 [Exophiala aquamarina CBS 119918]
MPQSPSNNEPHKKRRFKIQSEFGNARQWRSRKSRPCDICRKRKTACVIEDRPPCLFCKGRGLDCTSSLEPQTVVQRFSSLPSLDQDEEPPVSLQTPIDGPPPESPVFQEHITPSSVEVDHTMLSPATSVEQMRRRDHFVNLYPSTPSRHEGSLEPKIYTLEDNKNQTAHSMGLSAEQDTNLLATYRSVIINESNRVAGDIIKVYPGNVSAGAPPLHFYILSDLFMPYDNCLKEECSQLIESKVEYHGPSLVRLYFRYVHPVYCIVSKVRFLRSYKEDRFSIPASLRGAIYGLGAVFWNHDPELSAITRPFEQYELFQAAQTSLERELEAPNLWKMQACLLMLHERAAGNGVFETPRTWTLSAQAVACAQMIGLHRDPSEWNIASWEKSLRKKLWWATYITDTWSSVSHGNPPHIHKDFYGTSNLDMEDLRYDEDVPEDLQHMVDISSTCFEVSTAARFLELVKLTQILGGLLDASFPRAAMNCTGIALDPNEGVGPLHLAYFATQVLLLRALMSPGSAAAKNDPQSSLRRYFPLAIEQMGYFLTFTNEITLEALQSFWGRREFSSSTLSRRQEI